MTNTYYYIDMDGVLADFFAVKDAVKRCAIEEGFFAKLQPIIENVQALKAFIARGGDVRILSSSINERTDADKRAWLAQYLPEVSADRIIFARGRNKKKFMVTDCGVLVDDNVKNCHSWELREGNRACLVTGSIEMYLL